MQVPGTAPYYYCAYGVNIVSDIALIRLNPGSNPNLDTITIRRETTLPRRPENAQLIGAIVWASAGYLSLDLPQIVNFVAMNGTTLHYIPCEGIDDASVQLFLLGSGLGALLMQRELLVMHGNAIEIDGTCVMCVGPSGIGKSTTAAGMMQRGYRVMSDDICAIDNACQIVPGMPHIKLWQDTADELNLATSELDCIRPGMAKFGVPLDGAFCDNTSRVKLIYELSAHQSDQILFETLTAQQKFNSLRENTYRLPFIAGMGLGKLHFQQLVDLANQTVVKRIKRPASGFDLDRLLDCLTNDVQLEKQRQ